MRNVLDMCGYAPNAEGSIMNSDDINSTSNSRINVALLSALGKNIYEILQDPLVTDLMLNENG